MVSLVPLTMIFLGHRYQKKPPKKISTVSGYRTARSMKNEETWKFAHVYAGKLMKVCGWILLPVTVAVMLLVLGKDVAFVGITGGVVCAVQILIMVCTIIFTEIALKRNFGKNENRY